MLDHVKELNQIARERKLVETSLISQASKERLLSQLKEREAAVDARIQAEAGGAVAGALGAPGGPAKAR